MSRVSKQNSKMASEYSLEKKAKTLNEPEYSDTIFEDTLAELKARELAFRETLKQARRLVVDFKASMSQKMVDALVEDGVDLRVPFMHVKPEDAPIHNRITYERVGFAVLHKLEQMLPGSTFFPGRAAQFLRGSIWAYMQAICNPHCQKPDVFSATAIADANQLGMPKLAEYLPRLQAARDKFFRTPLFSFP